MSRSRRIEFPVAVSHVTSRGDRRELIYRDEADRAIQLAVQRLGVRSLMRQVSHATSIDPRLKHGLTGSRLGAALGCGCKLVDHLTSGDARSVLTGTDGQQSRAAPGGDQLS